MKTRAVEWLLSWYMVAWGLGILLGAMIYGVPSNAKVLLELGDLKYWAAVTISFGSLRMIALIYNGHWRRSPLARMATAIVGAAFWTLLGGMFAKGIITGVTPYFAMVWAFPILVSFELYSVWRCGEDAVYMNSFRFTWIDYVKARWSAIQGHGRDG